MVRRLLTVALAVLIALAVIAGASPRRDGLEWGAADARPAAALVHFGSGGDMPTTTRLAAGLRQDTPFDGVVVAVAGNNLTPAVATTAAQLDADRANLIASIPKRGNLRQVWLRAWMVPPVTVWDWRDPGNVDRFLATLTALADLARDGQAAGLMVDTEAYDQRYPWSYPAFTTDFEGYDATVRAVGVRAGQILAARGVPVWLTLGLSGALWWPDNHPTTGLFVEGLLAAGASVTDGNLLCYWCSSGQYRSRYNDLKAFAPTPAMQVGQPVYVHPGRSASAIRTATTYAMRYSDTRSWAYTEGYGVWDGTMPRAVLDAIATGKRNR